MFGLQQAVLNCVPAVLEYETFFSLITNLSWVHLVSIATAKRIVVASLAAVHWKKRWTFLDFWVSGQKL